MRLSAWSCISILSVLLAISCGDNNLLTPDAPQPACADGADNDGDGQVDYPDDLGCDSETDDTEDSLASPSCSDKRDNDGDGKVDYPEDPGCLVPQSDSEVDDCPSGPGCPQCADGVDNDGNGEIDYPDDAGCASASDTVELLDDPSACGANLRIKLLPPGGIDTGMLATTSTSMLTTPCGGGGGAPGIAYIIHLQQPRVLVATTDHPATTVDTVLDLRSAMCDDPGAHITCHDDISTSNKRSSLVRALPAGTYYLIVQSSSATETGSYGLAVELRPGQGATCALDSECGPGLVCRIPAGGSMKVCSPPVCSDMIDDDGDGKIDHPNDPGCATPSDDTEDDVCQTAPTDPACPVCSNGLDDDGDGLIDYPDDPSCVSAATINEACAQSEAVIIATTPQTTGTTAGAVNDFQPPPGSYNGHLCSTTATHSAPDRAIELDVPALTSLSIKLNPVGFDSSHSLLDASCTGMPIDCYDNPNNMVLGSIAAGRYYVIIDGYSSASGTFTMNVSGTIVNGESCEAPLAQSGALVCGPGHACRGPAGSRTCAPAACNDGMDNNMDGRTDFPADPGCTSTSDDSEDTVCPGAACPACADGVDNDGDGLIDYPADTGCLAASATNEGCAESDPIVAITQPTTTGTLAGAVDDHNPSCVTSNHPDKIFTLDIPTALQSLVIDTEDSVTDTVLSLMSHTCTEPSIACDDDGGVGTGDSLITRAFVPAGSYTIAVDADTTTYDTFNVNVRGTILPGGSCEGALFQSGVLVCPAGFGCNGTPGSRKCTAAQCQDGADNNLDGKVDYPDDPGCDSPSDNTETTVCPGASCPVCADGLDNDGDGAIDYPADTGCAAASGGNEGCADSDPITPITAVTTTGTLVGATDDHDPFCTTVAGVDRMFSLDVPDLLSLTIDTEGSVIDTALSLMNSACQEPAIACDDDGGVGTGDSLIVQSFVPAGLYTIAIDAESATPNTFILNVSGVIAPGDSCEHPLFDAGVLTCSTGFACTGPMGARTCAVAECLDGFDNNGDGRIDFPEDPGCETFSDGTEDTVCPGAACPVCSDGIDNDGDGATDYPADASCFAASAGNEACTQSEPIGAITQPITTGNTAGQSNDYTPPCGTTGTHSAPDLVYALELPPMATLSLGVVGFTSRLHSLLDATCGGTPVACSSNGVMALANVAGGTYYVVIDGFSTTSGAWTLTTSGTVAPGGSCEGALFQSGAFTCTTGFACAGPAGARTCAPAQCNDGIDNNGDGLIDFPFDPGCANPSDDAEDTVCPGAACPACSNTTDDEGDGLVDYPADFGCYGAGGTSEAFCPIETNPVAVIAAPQTAGTLAAPATDNYEQSCQTSTGNDVAYALRLPVPVATLVVDTLGSTIADTVVSIWDANCGAEIECDDDDAPGTDNRSLITLSGLGAGNYAIQVDGFSSSNNGAFVLNVKGTVAAGTACTDPLFAAGVLVCPMGTTCSAGVCQ